MNEPIISDELEKEMKITRKRLEGVITEMKALRAEGKDTTEHRRVAEALSMVIEELYGKWKAENPWLINRQFFDGTVTGAAAMNEESQLFCQKLNSWIPEIVVLTERMFRVNAVQGYPKNTVAHFFGTVLDGRGYTMQIGLGDTDLNNEEELKDVFRSRIGLAMMDAERHAKKEPKP